MNLSREVTFFQLGLLFHGTALWNSLPVLGFFRRLRRRGSSPRRWGQEVNGALSVGGCEILEMRFLSGPHLGFSLNWFYFLFTTHGHIRRKGGKAKQSSLLPSTSLAPSSQQKLWGNKFILIELK